MTLLASAFVLWAAGSPALADRRVALVIGNSDYVDVPALENPRNDAEDVAAALKRLGFETVLSLDAGRDAMQKAIDEFSAQVEGADVALFYYAGHAMQHQGVNYLIPVDGNLSNAAGLRRMTKLNDIVSDVKRAKALRIMVLDACRDNPLIEKLDGNTQIAAAAGASRSAGLAKLSRTMAKTATQNAEPLNRGGDIIVYAAEAGHTAADGVGRNSPFSAAFVKYVETEGQEVVSLMRRITTAVQDDTKGAQRPELSLAVPFEFYFKPGPPAPPPTVLQLVPTAKPHEVGAIETAIGGMLRAITANEREQARREIMVLLSDIASGSGLKPEQIAQELPQSYAKLMQTRASIELARDAMESEPEVGPFLEIAAAAVASGRRPDRDAAEQALAQARVRFQEMRRLRNLRNERANERTAANLAILSEQQGNIAMTGSRIKEAADFYLTAARETPASDPEKAGRRFQMATEALLRHGVAFFANDALRETIRIAQDETLPHYDRVITADADVNRMLGALRAMALADLADAQSMLSVRLAGPEGAKFAQDADQTYLKAIASVDFDTYPSIAMSVLDRRAFHLTEFGRRVMPVAARMIFAAVIEDHRTIFNRHMADDEFKDGRLSAINNFAHALHESSLRYQSEEGDRQIDEAISLLEKASTILEGRIEREKNIVRANLARALGAREARRRGPAVQAELDRARDLFAEVNKTLSRDTEPWLWAYLKRFEGQFLRVVGQRSRDEARALEALRASRETFQAILATLTRESPNEWAIISAELGYTLVATLRRAPADERRALAEEAIRHFESARPVFEAGRFEWDTVWVDEAMRTASAAIRTDDSVAPPRRN